MKFIIASLLFAVVPAPIGKIQAPARQATKTASPEKLREADQLKQQALADDLTKEWVREDVSRRDTKPTYATKGTMPNMNTVRNKWQGLIDVDASKMHPVVKAQAPVEKGGLRGSAKLAKLKEYEDHVKKTKESLNKPVAPPSKVRGKSEYEKHIARMQNKPVAPPSKMNGDQEKQSQKLSKKEEYEQHVAKKREPVTKAVAPPPTVKGQTVQQRMNEFERKEESAEDVPRTNKVWKRKSGNDWEKKEIRYSDLYNMTPYGGSPELRTAFDAIHKELEKDKLFLQQKKNVAKAEEEKEKERQRKAELESRANLNDEGSKAKTQANSDEESTKESLQ